MTPKELKKWRERNGYTQRELADILRVAMETVSRWERGTRHIPSFLPLTLECVEKKRSKRKEVKK
jgi:transcriptional regulator with XRE-family HTH domain